MEGCAFTTLQDETFECEGGGRDLSFFMGRKVSEHAR